MSFKVFPHNMRSASATVLATALGVRKIYPDRGYTPQPSHTIINWGCSSIPNWMQLAQRAGTSFLNPIAVVAIAQNKLSTLQRLRSEDVLVPEFTTDQRNAQLWLEDGCRVYCRTLLRGSEGRGIVCVTTNADDTDYEYLQHTLVDAPLYVKGITGTRTEYRLHVVAGTVVAASRKRQLTRDSLVEREIEHQGSYIRNSTNGYIYSRIPSQDISNISTDVSIRAVSALGLDFGAVDLIIKGRNRYVLEINTAPGLEGETIEAYAMAFRSM